MLFAIFGNYINYRIDLFSPLLIRHNQTEKNKVFAIKAKELSGLKI